MKRIDKTISDFETEILLKKNKGNPDLIRLNLQNEKQSITDKLDKTNLDYKSFLKEKSWVDWLKTYQSDVGERETTLSDQEKYQYLSNLLDDIKVNFDHDNNCHSLEINFNIPIVNDSLKYNNPKNKTDGWSVEDGDLFFKVENLPINKGGRPSKKNAPQLAPKNP